MALKINAGENVKRGDIFFVDPFQVIVKEELRGRHKPPTEKAIIDMACSLMDNGQRQAVECRKLKDNRLQLNLGFTRTAAARLIRNGFTDPDGNERKDEEFMLKVMISDANDEVAFINNVVENAHRNQTSPIDDAHNQHKLRDQLGKTDAEIMRLYRYRDENKVARLRRLLSLPTWIQDLVHEYSITEGETGLPVKGALDLLDLPEDQWEEAIKSSMGENGRVVAAKLTAHVREHNLEKAESNGDGNGEGGGLPEHVLRDKPGEEQAGSGTPTPDPKKYHARVLSDLRKMFEFFGSTDDAKLKEFGKLHAKFIKGHVSDRYYVETICKMLGVKTVPVLPKKK